MKNYQLRMVWIFIAVVSVCGMCSKNDAPSNNPPGEIKISKGFLATMAPRSSGQLDTVAIKNGGAFNLSHLSEAAITQGTFERPRDVWQVANDGSGHWYFKRGDGKYLSIGDAQTGGYDWDTSPQISESTRFIINKDDKDRFYIESALHRGYYLISKVCGTPPAHCFIDFTANKQLWFIRP